MFIGDLFDCPLIYKQVPDPRNEGNDAFGHRVGQSKGPWPPVAMRA
jgi:hypothetical protein